MLLHELFAAAGGLEAFELEIAVVEPGDQLILLHDVAGPDQRLADVALEGRRERALDRTFDPGVGRDAVVPGREREEQHERRDDEPRELPRGVAGAEEAAPERLHALPRAGHRAALGVALDLGQRTEQSGKALDEIEIGGLERPVAFEAQRADRLAEPDERHRQDALRALRLGESLVGAAHVAVAFLEGRPRDRRALVDGLLHRLLDRARQFGLLLEIDGVRERLHARTLAVEARERDPVAVEHRRELGDRRRRGGHEAVMLERRTEEIEHLAHAGGGLGVLGAHRPAQQRLEPAGAPREIARQTLQSAFVERRDVDGNGAEHLAFEFDGLGDMEPVVGGGCRDERALLEGTLDGFGKLRAIATSVGPCGRGDEAPAVRAREDEDAVGGIDARAGHGEPAVAERLDGARGGEARPGVVFGSGPQPRGIRDLEMRTTFGTAGAG